MTMCSSEHRPTGPDRSSSERNIRFGEPISGKPAAHRPAPIIGPPASFLDDFPYRIVAPLTTTDRSMRLHVHLEPGDRNGLERSSFVQCEFVRSVSARRLVHRIGSVDIATRDRVHDVLDVLFDR